LPVVAFAFAMILDLLVPPASGAQAWVMLQCNI
jgi:hypothetical protein